MPEPSPATAEEAAPPSYGLIYPLLPSQADAVWPVLFNVLKPCLERMSWQYAPSDVRERLGDSRFAAFVAEVEGEVKACLIAETLVFPRCRCLSLVALAGIGEGNWPQWLEIIACYAREMGCRYLVSLGARSGWARALKDTGLQKIGDVVLFDLQRSLN